MSKMYWPAVVISTGESIGGLVGLARMLLPVKLTQDKAHIHQKIAYFTNLVQEISYLLNKFIFKKENYLHTINFTFESTFLILGHSSFSFVVYTVVKHNTLYF